MAYQVTAGHFVGRTQPLAAVLAGEAGIGKTGLVEQLAAAAEEQGVRVLGGGCVPLGEEGVPFAPVIQALRGLAGELDPAELQAVAGPAQQELARLLPDLARVPPSRCWRRSQARWLGEAERGVVGWGNAAPSWPGRCSRLPAVVMLVRRRRKVSMGSVQAHDTSGS